MRRASFSSASFSSLSNIFVLRLRIQYSPRISTCITSLYWFDHVPLLLTILQKLLDYRIEIAWLSNAAVNVIAWVSIEIIVITMNWLRRVPLLLAILRINQNCLSIASTVATDPSYHVFVLSRLHISSVVDRNRVVLLLSRGLTRLALLLVTRRTYFSSLIDARVLISQSINQLYHCCLIARQLFLYLYRSTLIFVSVDVLLKCRYK